MASGAFVWSSLPIFGPTNSVRTTSYASSPIAPLSMPVTTSSEPPSAPASALSSSWTRIRYSFSPPKRVISGDWPGNARM